eukprot:TRINITY_DN7113_c0_g1_i1.p1 TRINITY_DN7113_c0_g1~~TRINITY_DN7113_c0_g1_i1.p1  ORF type:complete len:279 (+),score=59.97 TRINITY_DN7113_c0_g1_i1:64-900(+)
MRFFEEQKRKGPVGEAAVRLEILIIVLSALTAPSLLFSFYKSSGAAVLGHLIQFAIYGVGFHGCYKLNNGLIMLFIFCQVFLTILEVIMFIFGLWLTFELATDNTTLSHAFAIVTGFVLVMTSVDVIIKILSTVWATQVRKLNNGVNTIENGLNLHPMTSTIHHPQAYSPLPQDSSFESPSSPSTTTTNLSVPPLPSFYPPQSYGQPYAYPLPPSVAHPHPNAYPPTPSSSLPSVAHPPQAYPPQYYPQHFSQSYPAPPLSYAEADQLSTTNNSSKQM